MEYVEDYYSGIPKDPNPSMMKSDRMYRAFDDNIERRPEGGFLIRTKGNEIEIEKDGSFRILDRKTKEIWLMKLNNI